MIRPLSESDRTEALSLIRQFFACHSSTLSSEEASEVWEQWLQAGMLFGYESDGRLLGLIRFREDHGTYWIENLVVDESKRGTGIGSEILKWAEDWVKSKGARSLFLDVVPANLEALDFFLRHGYCYLNTIELRKNFYDTPPKAEVIFLGRRFQIYSWPLDKPLP